LAGKRTAELVQRYVDLLGGGPLSIDTQAQVLSAAELQILAEQARFAALESETPEMTLAQYLDAKTRKGEAQP
jgi:hypothetical protein